jgi:uncharacterized protein (TIGR02246 family)
MTKRSSANQPGADQVTARPLDIAEDFVRRFENAWNSRGPAAAAALYAPDAILAGAATGVGRTEIERLLQLLFQQGWTRISIKVAQAGAVGGVVLVVSEFSASGSGANAGKTLNGRSSHVLTEIDGVWLSAMHTAA